MSSSPEGMKPTRRDWICEQPLLGPERAAAFEVSPGPLEWLVDLWHDAGQARVAMGPTGGVLLPLGWPEIHAWVEGAGEHDLSPTFRRAIILMSNAYAEVVNGANERSFKAPYEPPRPG